jgi:uracil phosphoribosyltransferase
MAMYTRQLIRQGALMLVYAASLATGSWVMASQTIHLACEQVKGDDQRALSIVKCFPVPSRYEQVLMTRLRDKTTSTKDFRETAQKIAQLLVNKVVECLPTQSVEIETPLMKFTGEALTEKLELVSIMRSGDAILDAFIEHFPQAAVSKILIQRDEETAEPHFKYMKLSPSIASGHSVTITEPMLATGGTLNMVIELLKEKGVKEENIIIASICVAPQGLAFLSERYPDIKVVMTVIDEGLNEKMYIVPGIGDFGDRYFLTTD